GQYEQDWEELHRADGRARLSGRRCSFEPSGRRDDRWIARRPPLTPKTDVATRPAAGAAEHAVASRETAQSVASWMWAGVRRQWLKGKLWPAAIVLLLVIAVVVLANAPG